MARQTLTKTTPPGNRPGLPLAADAADLAMTQADTTNKEQFAAAGKDVVIAHNTGVGAVTVTITSAADAGNRSGDIETYSIGAGKIAVLGPFKLDGWVQTDGYIYLEASSTDIYFGVIEL